MDLSAEARIGLAGIVVGLIWVLLDPKQPVLHATGWIIVWIALMLLLIGTDWAKRHSSHMSILIVETPVEGFNVWRLSVATLVIGLSVLILAIGTWPPREYVPTPGPGSPPSPTTPVTPVEYPPKKPPLVPTPSVRPKPPVVGVSRKPPFTTPKKPPEPVVSTDSDLSNEQLAQKISSLVEHLTRNVNEFKEQEDHFRSLADSPSFTGETRAQELQNRRDFIHEPDNQEMFTEANALFRIALLRLHKPVPSKDLFDQDWIDQETDRQPFDVIMNLAELNRLGNQLETSKSL
jgi:hypothetical protein